jgi:phosphoserine phosphatase RsbU/P
VTGSGTVAATVAVMIKYTMRAYALENAKPGSILTRLNEAALNQTDEDTYVTVCCALIDPAERTVSIANAGHPPIIYYRSREKECIPGCGDPGIMAGFLPRQEYATKAHHPTPGDILVFYTDGVTEARRNKEMFGSERLTRILCENSFLSAQEIAAAIYAAVTDFVGGERSDDLALLVLKSV